MATKVNPVTGALDYYEQALPPFRNKLINGNFDFWQRGTSQTSSGYGSADRWSIGHGTSSKTASQQSFVNGQTDVPNNPKYYLRHVVTSSSGGYVVLSQNIEGVETLAGKAATLSFWARTTDSNKNIASGIIRYYGSGGSTSGQDDGIGVTTHTLTTSWQKFTVTTTIPSMSGKNIGTDNNDFLGLEFWFDAGSSLNSRTNSLGNQSGTFDIAQVQLEEGTSATPFEIRPVGTELSLCQRYFEKVQYSIGAVAGTVVNRGTRFPFRFAADKRATPSVTISSSATVRCSTPTGSEVYTTSVTLRTTNSNTDGDDYSAQGSFTASSEL